MAKLIMDHLGNVYNTVTEMCKHYGISLTLYMKRRERGKSIEEALAPVLKYSDGAGNKFPTKKAIANRYGIKYTTFIMRLKNGHTVDEAIAGGNERLQTHFVTDHLGVRYTSIPKMCASWGVNIHTYRKDIQNGLSVEEALTRKKKHIIKVKQWEVFDHKGNKYRYIKDMCKAYDIPYNIYMGRINKGFSVEEALTTPVRTKRKR